jgi:hypothetical protein
MGKGIFATRDIQLGEIIFAERPLLVLPRVLVPTANVDLSAHSKAESTKILMFQREQQLEIAVGRMEPGRRAEFMALVNRRPEDGRLNGIVNTNGYEVDNLWNGDVEPDEGDRSNPHRYGAVCGIGSRINHRCVYHCFE